jgi:hypothetical protein
MLMVDANVDVPGASREDDSKGEGGIILVDAQEEEPRKSEG